MIERRRGAGEREEGNKRGDRARAGRGGLLRGRRECLLASERRERLVGRRIGLAEEPVVAVPMGGRLGKADKVKLAEGA